MNLIDTDILIDYLHKIEIAEKFLESIRISKDGLNISIITRMELIQGCRNKEEQFKIENKISTYQILWPSSETCDKALKLFTQYNLTYKIGIIDALIGQLAVDMNVPLYTFNEKHYLMIPKIRMIQPYKKPS